MDKLTYMDKPIFTVRISPHRSLEPGGFAVLIAAVASLNLIGGTIFWFLGAWPVVGFMGLDVLLVWLAFRWSYRRAALSESLIVTGNELRVSRQAHNRITEELAFPRGFVHVDLERDTERDLVGRLLLRSKGRAYEIGAFLGPRERSVLAESLRNALFRPKI